MIRIALVLAALVASPAWAGTVHVGYQRYGTLIILKERGTLDAALKKIGWTVQWKLFPSGPPLLEAMNAGALDFGVTGETPPIFAQAAGAPMVYVGAEPPAPTGEAIVVPADSKITTLAGLKGKRVAYTRGSNGNYLLLRALEAGGLKWSDITPVNLAPADGPAAFQQGAVDAWAIWDPYLSAARTSLGARVLRDGQGLVPNREYFLAAKGFAEKQKPVLALLLDQVKATDAWSITHQSDVTDLLSGTSGLSKAVVAPAVSRLAFGIGPMTPAIVADQQKVADAIASIGLIPSPVHVADLVPSPAGQ
jgi:sulfonate transport system substrate-binding protein